MTLWASVGGLALAHDRHLLLAPFRRRGLLARVAVVDVLIIPVATWAIVQALDMPEGFALGILLVGMCCGGPLGIVATQLARGDTTLALALVALLEVVNLFAIPIWSSVLLPDSVSVQASEVLLVLVAYVLAPLGAGLVIRARSERLAARIQPICRPITAGGVAFAVVYVVGTNWQLLGPAAAGGVVTAAFLVIGLAMVAGWVAAGGTIGTRKAVALVTAQRGNSLALAISVTAFAGIDEAAVAIVVFGMFSLIVVPTLGLLLGRAMPQAAPLPA